MLRVQEKPVIINDPRAISYIVGNHLIILQTQVMEIWVTGSDGKAFNPVFENHGHGAKD